MITILAYTPGPKDPTSFYRALMPLYQLAKNTRIDYDDIRIVEGDLMKTNWSYIAQADIIFIHRPHRPAYRQVVEIAKDMDIPVWIDLDDDHLNVPLWYDIHHLYNDMDNRQSHIDVVQMADVLTVSTDQLAENYKKVNQLVSIITIPNAIPDWLMKFAPYEQPQQKENPKILWRGSDKHSRDLAMFLPQINKLIAEGVDITFFGYRPEVSESPNVHFVDHTPTFDILQYFQKLRDLEPDLVIVLLDDNDFNRCKSNNAMLEAYWAGAECLAPNMPEWSDATRQYNNPDDFVSNVMQFIANYKLPDTVLDQVVKKIRRKPYQHLIEMLSSTNNKRKRIIEQLLKGTENF